MIRALQSLLNILGDQQLISGICICIVAHLSLCQISLYHWLNAGHFAMFSFAVHFLTIISLQDVYYRVRRTWAFRMRIGLIYTNVALLSPILYHVPFMKMHELNISMEARPAIFLLTGAYRGQGTVAEWVGFVLSVVLIALSVLMATLYVTVVPPSSYRPEDDGESSRRNRT
ncbi:hypothetical protein B0H63DRAFT_486034 [Podospora didyma]|uniref:Uncharacterized protein n=1 Tax=Podospora didyma TaxID=330526 RepID=A0AAE0N4N6_9PEZI|nr:hypothetical protein B0H63DRAFT_486034 [Podospora didyma]